MIKTPWSIVSLVWIHHKSGSVSYPLVYCIVWTTVYPIACRGTQHPGWRQSLQCKHRKSFIYLKFGWNPAYPSIFSLWLGIYQTYIELWCRKEASEAESMLSHKVKTQYVCFRTHTEYFLLPSKFWKNQSMILHN